MVSPDFMNLKYANLFILISFGIMFFGGCKAENRSTKNKEPSSTKKTESQELRCLLDKLESHDDEVQESGCRQLMARVIRRKLSSEAKPLIPRMMKLLKKGDSDVKLSLLVALGSMGANAKEAIPSIKQLLKHSNELVCACAEEAIGQITEQKQNKKPSSAKNWEYQQLRRLLDKLESHDREVRINGCRQLMVRVMIGKFSIAVKPLIPQMTKLLEKGDSDVKLTLLAVLGSMRADAKDAIPSIKQLLKHGDMFVRAGAKEAIEQITGQKQNEGKNRENPDMMKRLNPAVKLGKSGDSILIN
ncbi:MAG: hypothetical protein K8S55_07195 [Phycisphaerae bacterium]|nr:hypothetical protein [Phycisphaerae bacterium]